MSSHLQLAPQHGARVALTVLLAEGHELMRSSLRRVLEADGGIALVAEVTDVTSVRHQIRAHRPQILVLDLRLGSPSPFETIRDLHREALGTAIVVISMETGRAFAERALTSGALGYVVKDSAEIDLPAAIRCAGTGERYVSPQVLDSAQMLAQRAPEGGNHEAFASQRSDRSPL